MFILHNLDKFTSTADKEKPLSVENMPDCAFALANGEIFWTIASIWQNASDDRLCGVFERAPIAHQSCVLKRTRKSNAQQYTLRNLPIYAINEIDTSFAVMSLLFEMLLTGGKLQVAVDDALFEHLLQITMQLQLTSMTETLFNGAVSRRDRAQFAVAVAALSKSKAHESFLHALLENSRLLRRNQTRKA